ncbi:MAG: YkgJ family cysteine cluster protein [Chloroflexota bacterium]|nr:YkgJ family cysteine cluster protein [Chloroflexota bacterium]
MHKESNNQNSETMDHRTQPNSGDSLNQETIQVGYPAEHSQQTGAMFSISSSEDMMECLRCGFCCTYNRPPLTSDDLDRISTGLGMTIDDFVHKYTEPLLRENSGFWLASHKDACVFLARKLPKHMTSCTIYELRPEACRLFIPSLAKRECRDGHSKLSSMI